MAKVRPKRRQPIKLPRQREHKPVMTPTQACRERIQSQLDDVIGSCEDLLEEHGADCECESCCVVSNFVGAIRLFHMVLEIS